LLIAVGLLAASAPASTSADTSPCPNASDQPAEATNYQLRHATLCLLNHARPDLAGPLELNHDLTVVARRHSNRMVAQRCFEHRCGAELRLEGRLRRSGYLDDAKSWRYAEELGYETTPSQMVDAWLDHADEAADLLSAKYTDVGIGIKSGAPEAGVDDSKFVTYTIDLAERKPAP
jgi:uncharacterized protein YkwD